jgi:nucleotide-binding universal stress UspA family protein
MFPTKILLAVDGSPGSARAARMAIELSNKLDSELHLVYVEPVNIHNIPERMIYAPDAQEHLEETFERFACERLDEEAAKRRVARSMRPTRRLVLPTRRSCASLRS